MQLDLTCEEETIRRLSVHQSQHSTFDWWPFKCLLVLTLRKLMNSRRSATVATGINENIQYKRKKAMPNLNQETSLLTSNIIQLLSLFF